MIILKKVENNFADCYYLTVEGKIYNSETNEYLEPSNNHSFRLKTTKGTSKSITLKKLYKLVYDKNYCLDTIEDLPNEQWKVIKNTNDNYLVSNMGRIKSYVYYHSSLLKPNKTKGNYERLQIYTKTRRVDVFVHKLVANYFLEKPKEEAEDLEQYVIHHIDSNPQNNRVDNLLWLTKEQHYQIHNRKEK